MDDNLESLHNITSILNMSTVDPTANLNPGFGGQVEDQPKSEFDLMIEKIKGENYEITEDNTNLKSHCNNDDNDDDGDAYVIPRGDTREDDSFKSKGITTPKKDDELYAVKMQQDAHGRMKSAMNEFGVEKVDYGFDKERKDDLRSAMLEEIDCLREELENCNIKIDGIGIPTNNSSDAEIESCLRILRKKSDRHKYCTYAEEGILMLAHGIEELFDGHNSFFGYRPNMRGWSVNVENKLRRMKYDTSKLVTQVMHDYNVGPGTRLLLELVPNAILYSIRKSKMSDTSVAAETVSAETMNKMRDIEFE